MTKRDVYLGLDIGTSGCKAVTFDGKGNQLYRARRDYALISPQTGWAELDARQVSEACLEVIREAASVTSGDIVAMGISSQGEAFTPVNRAGSPIGSACVSSDSRAIDIARDWPEQFGRNDLYRITGHTAHPMFSLFKLLWLRENDRRTWDRAAKFLCFEDLMHVRLGLEPAISFPLAGRTMLFDIERQDWSDAVLDAVGIRREQLARPIPSGQIVGRISGEMARDLGLASGAIVVAGGHDQICASLGAGATTPGDAVFATGTVDCITPAFGEPIFDNKLALANLCTYHHAIAGLYASVAFSLTGGNLLDWFVRVFGFDDRTSGFELALTEMPKTPTGLMVVPYWTPSGTPYFDSTTPGVIEGLRFSTTRGDILRGLLEGVALEMRLNLDVLSDCGIHIHQLRGTGGPMRSDRWTQLRADVLGRPIVVMKVTEAGCLGVAMLACAACSGESLSDLANIWCVGAQRIEPNASNAASYEERFVRYQQLYKAIRASW